MTKEKQETFDKSFDLETVSFSKFFLRPRNNTQIAEATSIATNI
jgi:hypothetical protein